MPLSHHNVITILPTGCMVEDHMVFHDVVSVVILFPPLNPMGTMLEIQAHALLENVMIL